MIVANLSIVRSAHSLFNLHFFTFQREAMATGEVDLGSLPAEEIFKLLESNNQEVRNYFTNFFFIEMLRWCLRFKDSSMKI